MDNSEIWFGGGIRKNLAMDCISMGEMEKSKITLKFYTWKEPGWCGSKDEHLL